MNLYYIKYTLLSNSIDIKIKREIDKSLLKSVKLPIVEITNQFTPFLNNVSFFESFCSFNVGSFTAIKKASRIFVLRLFIGADIRTLH